MPTAKLIQPSDFVGKYGLSTDMYNKTVLQTFCNDIEDKWLRDLFGKTMADDFLADVTGGLPVSAKYLALYNPLDNDLGDSDGMKEMLMRVVYLEFPKYQMRTNTTNGMKGINTTNSTPIHLNALWYSNKMNEAVNDYQVIQYEVMKDRVTYPDYDGKHKDFFSHL